jgi:GT2 family glycosyltransferase
MKEYPLVSVVIPTHNRKEKLIRLINSILKSNYPKDKIEIIVVDDASTDGTSEDLRKCFPTVKVITNPRESFLAGSRNVGILDSKGDFIFLIDDDNVVDPNTLSELVKVMQEDEKIGVVGPLMYYYGDPKRIWCAGIKRNYITSKTMFLGQGELDEGQYEDLADSEEFPNAFMVRRKVIEEVGLFDEETFPFGYGEADFCQRVKRAHFKIVTAPRAKVWHDIPVLEKEIHFDEKRAYYHGRNRIIFHRRYSRGIEFALFIMFFEPFFIIPAYLLLFLFSKKSINKRLALILSYLRGVFDGFANRV